MRKGKTYLGRVFISIDQLANTIAGGNQDNTISGRLGYLSNYTTTPIARLLEKIVNITFYLIDGDNHCLQAYEKEIYEGYIKGHWTGLVALSIITVIACLVLIIPVAVYSLLIN